MAYVKRKRVVLTIDKKLEIISKLDQGVSLTTLAKEYNVGKSTVFDLKKGQDKIKLFAKEAKDSGCVKERFIVRKAVDENFDKAMHLWFSQERAKGTPITGVIVQEKAKMMYKAMYPEKDESHFKASEGWLHRFKQRHGIRCLSMQGEILSADTQSAENFKNEIKDLMEGERLTLDQVFNCDETGLYWRLLPGKTLADGNEKEAKNFKSSKDRVTLMATANASGDFRLPLVFIHKSAKPRCFANVTVSALPCHYYHQTSAWMNSAIFSDWFGKHFVPAVKDYLQGKSLPLRAILLMDNAPSHPSADSLVHETDDGCIRALFMPPNVTSLIQPMDQGVLENLKRRYKRDLLRKLLLDAEEFGSYTAFAKSLTVKDAVYMCAKAWREIREESLARAWLKLLPDAHSVDEDEEEPVQHTEEGQQLALTAEEEEEWLNADRDEAGHPMLTDQEIINQVSETADMDSDDGDDEEDAGRIPHAVATECLSTSLRWLEQQAEATPMNLLMLRELHAMAAKKRVSNLKQPRLDSFFVKK